MKASHCGSIRFGVFEFSPQAGELRKQGMRVKIGPQACKVLALLLEHPGQVQTREELRQRLWPADTFGDFEHSLNKAVHALREAVGDSATSPRYIETVVGQGYRFIPILQENSQAVSKRRSPHRIESVAVLPFTSETPDPELEFVNKKITERTVDTLSRVPGLRVLAYGMVQRYRQQRDPDVRRVGLSLMVSAVVAGELVRRNGELLLHVELIDVSDGSQRWGAQLKEAWSEVLGAPEKLADQICNQLRLLLVPKGKKVSLTGVKRSPAFNPAGNLMVRDRIA